MNENAKTSAVPSRSVIDRFCDVLEERIQDVENMSGRIDTISFKLAHCKSGQDLVEAGDQEPTCAIERVDMKLNTLASVMNNMRKSLCALEEVNLV